MKSQGRTMSRNRALLLLAALIVCSGCQPFSPTVLPDLQQYPQKAVSYVRSSGQAPLLDPSSQSKRHTRFRKKHFLPWHVQKPIFPRDKLFWPLQTTWDKRLFGENTLPRSKRWLDSLAKLAQPESFPLLNERGITLTNTNLRALPTRKPGFYDFKEPGEGYPFDYLQNSALWANTPVHITHASRDKEWLLVETGWGFGWVPAREVARVDPAFVFFFEQPELVAIIRDQVPVIDTSGLFRFMGHVGVLLPVVDRLNGKAVVLVASADARQRALPQQALLTPGNWAGFPLSPTPDNLARVADVFLGQTYGWGGLYANRDCSALTRDLFTPFAIWLPRNSAQQARQGRIISLAGSDPLEKKKIILERGVPFLTLLWKPGHIMLYIGSSHGQPLVLHSMWGLKTRDLFQGEGRYVIGRTVITSLAPEQGLPFYRRSPKGLLEKVQSLNILHGSTVTYR